MKKKTIKTVVSIIILANITANASSEIKGITILKSKNCSDGYLVKSERSDFNKIVVFDSCVDKELVVLDKEDFLQTEMIVSGPETINGVYYPNGYTETNVVAEDTCSTGFNQTAKEVSCTHMNSELSEGYLNLNAVTGNLGFMYSGIYNIDNLANLTEVEGYLGLRDMPFLSNLDGLLNLTTGSNFFFHRSPNLEDISGLKNLESISGHIYFDRKEFEVKLDKDTYICQNFETKVIDINNNLLNKSDICND